MEEEFQPKVLPTQLLTKDWSKRPFFIGKGWKDFTEKSSFLNVRDDDVWVVTPPKCGTTWMQELTWLVLNNYNFDYAKKHPIELRSPFVEISFLVDAPASEYFKNVIDAPSPRLIKTHMPLGLLPQQVWTKKPKVISVLRNPKDAFVSSYYFGKNFGFNLETTTDEVVSERVDNEIKTNSFFNHALEFYELRNENWVHYTSFENLKKNLRGEIEKVCKFLDKSITEDQMEAMLKHLSFKEMKNNPQCSHKYEIDLLRAHNNLSGVENSFMRKGKVGSYKEDLSAETIAKMDKWIEDSLRPHGLTLNDLLALS